MHGGGEEGGEEGGRASEQEQRIPEKESGVTVKKGTPALVSGGRRGEGVVTC